MLPYRSECGLAVLLLIAAVNSLFAAGIAAAADAPVKRDAKWAATSLDQVDDDFRFQGEFSGSIGSSHGFTSQTVGLQVVALGDGRFQAAAYPGGLPGAGWTRKDRLTLIGGREGEQVVLSGPGMLATVLPDSAQLATSNGQPLGTLARATRRSPTEGLSCPQNGLLLFTPQWKNGFKNSRQTEDGLLQVGTETSTTLRDSYMHLEFRLPYMPYARGQGRANSGVYLQSRYEVQILDSFGLEGKNNECGSLYTYQPPEINMCFPPLTWQTYDIEFLSPRFDKDGKKISNARLTVWHNGVLIQSRFNVERKTGAGQPEGPKVLPTKLQDHGNPVHFRNIWVVDYDQPWPESTYLVEPGSSPICPPASMFDWSPFPHHAAHGRPW